jgi:hypothetical protein
LFRERIIRLSGPVGTTRADPEVSLDLMFRAFFAIGGRLEDLTVGSGGPGFANPDPGPPRSEEAPAVKPGPRSRKHLA